MQKYNALAETKVKILMLGESGVGKSSILLRFAEDKFTTGYAVTLGVEFKQKKATINDKDVLIQVWDTAGQEQFRTITPIYYRNVDGVAIVYDITDEKSFESIISQENGYELKSKYSNIIEFIETSAKDSINIKDVFVNLTVEILKRRQQGNAVQQIQGQKLPIVNGKKKKGGCCNGSSKKH